jgi:hypothetical protein
MVLLREEVTEMRPLLRGRRVVVALVAFVITGGVAFVFAGGLFGGLRSLVGAPELGVKSDLPMGVIVSESREPPKLTVVGNMTIAERQ